MPKARVRDLEMFYIDVGSGAPVVLIMGFGGDHLAWGLQTPAFAATHRVIAFDNRGVGQTDSPDIPYTTAMMATTPLACSTCSASRAPTCAVSRWAG